MKIAINGDIIDTKNIYKIHEIDRNDLTGGNWNHSFIIESFKNKYLYVRLYFTDEELQNKEDNDKHFIKINEFRDSIVKIWSENQSEIPQFNL